MKQGIMKLSKKVCLIIVLFVSACAPQANLAADPGSPASQTPIPPTATPTAEEADSWLVFTDTPPPPGWPTPTMPPEFAARFTQAVQTAQARYEQVLEGEALEDAERGLAIWQDISWHELGYAQRHQNEHSQSLEETLEIFLTQLEYRVDVDLKWAGFQKRTPEERQAAFQAVADYTGMVVSYQRTETWPFVQMIMVEVYNSGLYVYSVNIETDRIVEIEPLHDNTSTGIDYNQEPENGWELAKAVIRRLAPEVDLDQLTVRDHMPRYYVWEDRTAEKLQSSDYPYIQVQFMPDGTFVNFVNALPSQ